MKEPIQIHNNLFKAIFQKTGNMEGVLRTVLPPVVVKHIRWETLTEEVGTAVDAALQNRYSDLFFHAKLDEGEVLLYFLVEHQSTDDPRMCARAWIYLSRAVDRWMREHPSSHPHKIPGVVPIVVYHGDKPWQSPTQLLDLYDLPTDVREALADHLPNMRIVLDDLSRLDEEEIRGRNQLTAAARLAQGLLRALAFQQGSSCHPNELVATGVRVGITT